MGGNRNKKMKKRQTDPNTQLNIFHTQPHYIQGKWKRGGGETHYCLLAPQQKKRSLSYSIKAPVTKHIYSLKKKNSSLHKRPTNQKLRTYMLSTAQQKKRSLS